MHPPLRERLGLAPGAHGTTDAALRARVGFYLFTLGGTLGFVSLALPAAEGRDEPALAVAASVACALGILELLAYDRLPRWGFHALTVAATALVSAAVHAGGDVRPPYALFYLWVVLYAAYFFGAAATAAHVVAVAVGYALALTGAGGPTGLLWVLTVGTAAVVAALVNVLRTGLERLLEREREQVERLTVVDRMKDELVATASHELRTPVAAVYGAAETLLHRRELPAEQRRLLVAMIHRESARLAQLVSDVLLAANLDARRMTVQAGRVDVGEVVADAVAEARADTRNRCPIEMRLDEALPEVTGDRARLAQVLANLLDNARKYSPDGGTVEVAASATNGRVRIAVRDHGIGIPEEEREKIFDKFHRLDPNLTRGVGGTGLGLYIARELVRAMHGEISVSSQVGRGSTFVVELPAARDG